MKNKDTQLLEEKYKDVQKYKQPKYEPNMEAIDIYTAVTNIAKNIDFLLAQDETELTPRDKVELAKMKKIVASFGRL